MTDKKVINNDKKIDGDKFWSEKFSILYQTDRLTEFFPNYQMTMIEKLNALTRMSIYLGVILSVLLKNYLYLYIIIIGLLVNQTKFGSVLFSPFFRKVRQ